MIQKTVGDFKYRFSQVIISDIIATFSEVGDSKTSVEDLLLNS